MSDFKISIKKPGHTGFFNTYLDYKITSKKASSE